MGRSYDLKNGIFHVNHLVLEKTGPLINWLKLRSEVGQNRKVP
jgi:hypothetical protein